MLGILILVLALLLGASLVTYNPTDPSLMHQTSSGVEVTNLVGPLGANIAAATFEVFGLPALLLPVLLVGTAWQRLKGRNGSKVVGRGVGAIVLMLALPALLQVLAGSVTWRGVPLSAGGLTGKLIADLLSKYLNTTGAFVVLAGAVIAGVALLLQSTLGEFLSR